MLHREKVWLFPLQIYAVRLKGFGGKAANILALLVKGDPVLLAALRGLLQPGDVAALVTTAARGFKAEDVEVCRNLSRPALALILCCMPYTAIDSF